MEVLTIENLFVDQLPAALKIAQEGLALEVGKEHISIDREIIKTMDLFRGKRFFCLRISTDNDVYDLQNVHESFLGKIRTLASQYYGVDVTNTELETLHTARGNLVYSNSIVYLQSDKPVFGIPKAAIKNIIELENKLEFHLDEAEIVFNTTSNIAQFIGNKVSEEICIISGVNCINPRSKSTLIFFKDYFVLKGSSYDHSIFYNDVEEMFFLKRDALFYLVVKLCSCIVQGQTRYDSLVFLVGGREVEVAAKDSRLKPFYQEDQAEVLLQIMEALVKIKAQESVSSMKCMSKVFDGHLYLLNNSLQFLPKSISIPLNEISYVEFSRINLSMAQAKTFDMSVFAGKVYNFNGLPKDSFNELEVFFNEHGIKIVSEVIEESDSESSTETDGSDLSDIIDSEGE